MDLPAILGQRNVQQAAGLLRSYYTRKLTSGHVRTGASFDTWAGGGDAPDTVNRLTADDLVAVTLLGEDIKGPAALGLLGTYAAPVAELLEQIPADLDMADVPPQDYIRVYGRNSAAWQLWDVVRGYAGGQWRMGAAKTSKLLARKRPRLIPIWDPVLARAADLDTSLTYWEEWHRLLTADDGALVRRLGSVQDAADLPVRISALRAMDVILWMDAKQRSY
ncbi:DUF6308 family protein [Arthrobacter sp. zg-Y1143]|uniref:DUF6308 family protein n=1 Tax=Arthrobacter sp. zg-Y1143 TaxID=3049065 RepID=UPI0024C28D23|nr:DUF6308 family protein [Arthrobacter sp. zg-Y1143]MDK1326633.1 DUF6308 family protein [Arthrobacter sp. zg-Y1143]